MITPISSRPPTAYNQNAPADSVPHNDYTESVAQRVQTMANELSLVPVNEIKPQQGVYQQQVVADVQNALNVARGAKAPGASDAAVKADLEASMGPSLGTPELKNAVHELLNNYRSPSDAQKVDTRNPQGLYGDDHGNYDLVDPNAAHDSGSGRTRGR